MDKTLCTLLRCFFLAVLCAASTGTRAQADAPDALAELARRYAAQEAAAAGLSRVEVSAGRLDPRLRLPACAEVQPFLPSGARLWGRTRVGLRCVNGVTKWNAYVPVTVNVYGMALVSTAALPAGHVLSAADLRQAEVNLAEDMHNPALADAQVVLGRTLARALAPGQALKRASLKPRQWFDAGSRVRVRAVGQGYAVAGAGVAITAGLEGQPARVRTDSGRVVSGMPVAEDQLEIAL